MDKKIREMGFQPTTDDSCLYYHPISCAYLLLYVDDILLAAPSQTIIDQYLNAFEFNFPGLVKNMGFPEQALGIEIKRQNNGEIVISQESYIKTLATKYELQEFNDVRSRTPLDSSWFTRDIVCDISSPPSIIKEKFQALYGSLAREQDQIFPVRCLNWVNLLQIQTSKCGNI
jgi:hypothetical protein